MPETRYPIPKPQALIPHRRSDIEVPRVPPLLGHFPLLPVKGLGILKRLIYSRPDVPPVTNQIRITLNS